MFTPAAEQAALAPLFDLDATTCVDAAPLVALPQQSVFAGRMGLVAPGGGASIALRVTFEAAVTCEDRPVRVRLLYHSDPPQRLQFPSILTLITGQAAWGLGVKGFSY